MNDVGGSEGGTGLRATRPSRSSDTNFEYDDSEWDVGIGNLISDLDADIEKNNEAASRPGPVSSKNVSDEKRAVSTSPSSQMHGPQSSSSSSGTGAAVLGKAKSSSASSKTTDISTPGNMEHSAVVDKGLKMKIKRTKTSKSGADAKHEIVKSDLGAAGLPVGGTSSKSSNDLVSAKSVHSVSLKDKDKLKDVGTKSDLDKDANNSTSNSSVNGSGNTSKEKDASSNNSNAQEPGSAAKLKPQRKTSTHHNKKVKSGSSVPNNSTIPPATNKKEEKSGSSSTPLESKPLNSATAGGSSHTVNLNVPSVMSSSGSSAFAKTSAALKVPSAATVSAASSLASSLLVHSTTNADASNNHRSPSTTLTPTSWTSSSSIKATEKTSFLSLSNLGGNLNSNAEKTGRNSPSYSKKCRLFTQLDKVV